MRSFRLSLLVGASLAAATAACPAEAQYGVDVLGAAAAAAAAAATGAYFWGGRQYCWYPGGWNGPGWYWCGYYTQPGIGWGGGYGWHGWHGGGRGYGGG
ncbi:MAG: hypothetical protein WBF10_05195, partial [Methylovirgula sp.]